MLFIEATSFKPLAILRIGIAAALLVQGIVLWRYRDLLLAEFGPVPWILSDRLLDPLVPRLSYFTAWLAPFGVGSMQVVELFVLLHIAACAFLLLGYRTRWAAIGAWATYLPLRYTGHLYFYGVGGMLLLALFYCLFMPVGREWSIDRWLSARRNEPAAETFDASLSVVVLRLHVCIIYLAAGLSKAMGEQWWSGDAVWRALSLPRFAQFDLQALSAYPHLFQVMAIGAVTVQLAYPVLVWTRLRAVVVLVTELTHLGIAIFLGLWLFSAVMVVLNIAAFGESVWNALQRWLSAGRSPEAA